MFIIDYLIYFLTCWFEENNDKLKWSTPLQRACYALGMATICLFGAVCIIVISKSTKSLSDIDFICSVLVGLVIISIYNFIYIKMNRYNLILISRFRNYNKKRGMTLSLVFVAFSFLLPCVFAICFIKPIGAIHPY